MLYWELVWNADSWSPHPRAESGSAHQQDWSVVSMYIKVWAVLMSGVWKKDFDGNMDKSRKGFYLWAYQREETQRTQGHWTRDTNPKLLLRAEKSSLAKTISLDTLGNSYRLSNISSRGQHAYAVTSLAAQMTTHYHQPKNKTNQNSSAASITWVTLHSSPGKVHIES